MPGLPSMLLQPCSPTPLSFSVKSLFAVRVMCTGARNTPLSFFPHLADSYVAFMEVTMRGQGRAWEAKRVPAKVWTLMNQHS